MLRWCFCLVVLLAICPGLARGQGRLEDVRQQANSSGGQSNKHGDSDDDSGNFLAELLGALFSGIQDSDSDDGEGNGGAVVYALIFPFWFPHHLMDDDLSRLGYFPSHPYPDNYPAYLWQGRWPDADRDAPPQSTLPNTRWWSVRLASEDGNDFRGLNRLGVRATVDTASRFGVQSNWNYYWENIGGSQHDETLLGDTNLTYRFAQHEQIQMFTGIGFRVMTDHEVTNWGVNVLYGFDYFPMKPLVLSGQVDGGSLGSAAVFHARATLGVTKEHFEIFGGYDFLRIGSVNLEGPMLGLRIWF